MTSESRSLPEFPVPRDGLGEVPRIYEGWRREGPVKRVSIRDGKEAWVVTTHEAVREALYNTTTSAKRLDPAFPNLRAGVVALGQDTNLLHMDGEVHLKYRRMLAPDFTAKRIAALKPRVQTLVDDAVDRLLASEQPADFHQIVSTPVPSQTICLLLGVDYANHELFESLTLKLLDMTTTADAFQAALKEVEEFLREEVAKQQKSPGDGVIARLLREQVSTGDLTHEHVVGFAMLLLIGGFETTAKTITLGVLTLLTEPAKADAIRQDPSLMQGAIEEILRVHAITDLTVPRLAAEDTEIAGCPIRKGEGILPLVGAANHDPSVFENPQEVIPQRGERNHFTFGAGVHMCLGQNLARAELNAVFTTVLNRVPSLRLAVPVSQLDLERNAIVWGAKALPVAW